MLPLWIINLEKDEASEKKLAALLEGMSTSLRPYWHYSHLKTGAIDDGKAFSQFQGELVKEGQDCYNKFMDAGLSVGNFQIAVLGSAKEPLSRSVFAPMAGLIRDALPRIVQEHTNLGVEVTGLIYVPSTVNQEPDSECRKKIAVFLEEVNLLSGENGSGAYNRVVAYSDIQNESCRFYGKLNESDRTELLFQYLTNLFLGSPDSEKPFDKTGSGGGVYALGAASVYFNQKAHWNQDMKVVLDALIAELKDENNRDDFYAGTLVRDIIEVAPVFPENYAERLTEGCSSISVNLRKLEGTPNPHPVWNLLKVDLFPSYYRKYLRYMPARIVRYLQDLSYALQSRFVGVIRANTQKATEAGVLLLRSAVDKILLDWKNPYTTLAQLESFYEKARQRFEELRTGASLPFMGILPVPEYLKADYERCESGTDVAFADSFDKLKKDLRKEPVILSLVVRCFFLGVLLVFIALPVIKTLFPSMMAYAFGWVPLLLLFPLVIELLGNICRHFKRLRRLKYRLLAATLHSVNDKLFKELTDALDKVYDKLITECGNQLQLLKSFRELLVVPEPEMGDLLLPQTRFNQPLIEGTFKECKMVEDAKANQSRISLPSGDKFLSDIEKEDYIKLLGLLFQDPLILSSMKFSDATKLKTNADGLVEAIREALSGRIHSLEAAGISTVLDRLSGTVDLDPFRKMAGLNSMFFSTISNNPPIIKTSGDIRGLEGVGFIHDDSLPDYVMLTTWQKLPSGLNANQICDCILPAQFVPSFSDILALYYAYYREKKGAYKIGGVLVTVQKADMDSIDKMIRG